MQSIFRATFTLAFLLLTLSSTQAQSAPEKQPTFLWHEHFGPTFISGFITTKETGYIIVGNGSPIDGIQYDNSNASEFGVNVDANGNLFGLGWGEHVGWVDFDTRDAVMDRAHADWLHRKLRGFAWSESVGWISLDEATIIVRFATSGACTCGDVDGSGGLIDMKDFASFATCFGLTAANDSCDVSELNCSDLNGDGLVNLVDYETFALLLGTTTVGCPVLTISLDSPLVGVTRSVGGMVCIDQPAPPGGTEVTLNSLDTLIATVSPPIVTIFEGETCGMLSVTGVDFGVSNITANANGFALASTPITVTTAIISLGFGLQLIPGQTAGLPLSLSVAAPLGGVTVMLTSNNPSVATVVESVFIPEGQKIPAANPQVTGVQLGTVDITAETFGFAPDMREIIVAANVLTLNPTTLNVVESLIANITAQLQVSAPAGGQLIDLFIDDPGIATVSTAVLISAGENSVEIVVTGVLSGTTILHASSIASSIPEVTARINVGPAGINLRGNTIGDDLQVSVAATLTAAAPAGNLDVTITSDDPLRILLSIDPTVLGTASIIATVNAGSKTIPTFYVQSLDDSGSIGITATASGYLPGTANFSFAPSGFRIWSPSVINTTTFSNPTSVQIRPVRLDPITLNSSSIQSIRGGLSVDVDVLSSDTNVGTITISPLTFNGNDSFKNTAFEPLTSGSSNITMSTPVGFETPSNNQSIIANVTAPNINIGNATVGEDLQQSLFISLAATPPSPVDVTVTINDPSIAVISTNPLVAGSSIITFQNVIGTSVGTIYVQGLLLGDTTITVEAAGYNNDIADVTVVPSGFVIWTPNAINTTTFSNPTSVQIRPVRLNPITMNSSSVQNIRGGLSAIDIDVMSSDTNVGTITISPLTFNNNVSFMNTSFDPLIAGTSNISISTPAGFDTPSNNQLIIANVTAPNINLGNVTIGEDLQQSLFISLAATPPNPVDVTLSINDPFIATISTDPLIAGGSMITFQNVTTTSAGTIYVQGRLLGDTTISVQAAGYNDDSGDVTVVPSGFVIWTPNAINTTYFSVPTGVQIRPVRLNPITLNSSSVQAIRGGLSVEVDVMSSDTNVGTISVSPLTFNSNDSFMNTSLEPLDIGSTDISISTPIGFDTPSNHQLITANVFMPNINIGNVTVGEDLQQSLFISLAATPPNPVDVTITVDDSSIATISTDPLVAGSSSVTFFNVSSSTVGTIYVQGRLLGNTFLTVTAPDYNNGSSNVVVDPSGFLIWTPNVINTTSVSSPTTVQIRPVRLNPDTLQSSSIQGIRGGLSVDVDVMSSDTNVGTITISPLTFNSNNTFLNTTFEPIAAGVSTITVVTPPGFDTPTNSQSISANVSP